MKTHNTTRATYTSKARKAFPLLTAEKARRQIDRDHDAANFAQDIRESLAAGRPLAELVAKGQGRVR